METPHIYSRERLEQILQVLAHTEDYGQILRAKGIVPAGDGKWLEFDLTPGEVEIRDGAPDYTGRLCVIGAELKEEDLPALFDLA